ncbi:MAG: HNH endonuclease [Prevotellamassilia sp.]
MQKWSAYVKGDVKRQAYLQTALDWVSKSRHMSIDAYMSKHRHEQDIKELETYFRAVIDWVAAMFIDVEKDMCGLDWGRLYETFHAQPFNTELLNERIRTLRNDENVKCKQNVYEYVLGGEQDTTLLNIRLFEESTKKQAYARQTAAAKAQGISNCPLCAVGNNANRTRIYSLKEMDADHVTAWSKGGKTTLDNCEMLCKTHNRAKGNK